MSTAIIDLIQEEFTRGEKDSLVNEPQVRENFEDALTKLKEVKKGNDDNHKLMKDAASKLEDNLDLIESLIGSQCKHIKKSSVEHDNLIMFRNNAERIWRLASLQSADDPNELVQSVAWASAQGKKDELDVIDLLQTGALGLRQDVVSQERELIKSVRERLKQRLDRELLMLNRDQVVSFKTPINQSIKQKIHEMGATILQPLSGLEIIVSVASEDIANRILDLEEVAQVTPYIPRISVQPQSFQNSKQPATKEAISAARLKAAKNVNQSQSRINTIPGILVAAFFTSEDRDRAFQNLEAESIRIADVSGDKLLVIDVSSDSNPNESLRKVSAQVGLQSIEEKTMPRLFNERAATVIGTSIVASPLEPTIGLTGKGEIIAIADTGLDTGDPELLHPDFQGRVIDIKSYPIAKGWWVKYLSNLGEDDGPSDKYSGHGTHVAGSALGNGAQARELEISAIPMGIASEAQLVFQALEQTTKWTLDGILFYIENFGTMPPPSELFGIPEDLTELFQYAYDKGARIHSNSWGGGNPGKYNNQCAQIDQFVWDNPDFLIVIAAGNDGRHSSSGTTGIDQGSVTPPATAKNCLTIGASENDRSHQFSDTYGQGAPGSFPHEPFHSDGLVDYIDDIAAFSSRGPLVNGYRKPDVIAPGTFILSTRSSQIATNNFAAGAYLPAKYHYMYMTGTSMATPLVAGCAALVRQYLKEKHQPAILKPSAALVKAILIHSAQYIDYRHAHPASEPWADNEQGWGRINLQTVLNPVAPTQLVVNDESNGLKTDQDRNYKISITDSSVQLKITFVYNDLPGINLINNLNLRVHSPSGETYLGNDFQGMGNPDSVHNVEAVIEEAPEVGDWTIEIVAQVVQSDESQQYAIVATGGGIRLVLHGGDPPTVQ
jgi:serine protease AprX